MKKILLIMLSTLFMLSMTACFENTESKTEESKSSNETVSEENADISSSDDTGWRQFLKDYEAWVDDYIAMVKKYQSNPTDMSILSDYTEMMSELTNWAKRADEIEIELEDTDAAIEYSQELLRIAGKLAEVAEQN